MILTITFFAVVSSLLVFYFKKRFQYWNSKGIVYPKPNVLGGNYGQYISGKKNAWELDTEYYRGFPHKPMVGTYLGTKPNLILRDPELIKLIMTKDFYFFYHRGMNTNGERELLEMNLFAAHGDLWKVLRQNLTPLFSSHKMKNMYYLISECCESFVPYIDRVVVKSPIIDARDLTSRLTLEVIGSCAFGLQLQTMGDDTNPFHKMGYEIFKVAPSKFIKLMIRELFPKLFYKLDLKVHDSNVENFFHNLVTETIKQRRGAKQLRHDFIDLIMDLYDQGEMVGDGIEHMNNIESPRVKIPVDDRMITAQCFVFFAAGFETSSTTMSYALLELAHNKDVQDRLFEEINEISKKNKGVISYDAIHEMSYLDMVISETLRKYPVLGTITRKCMKKYKIPNTDIVIDEGTTLRIPVYAIHHDENHYPDPERFEPERFSSEEKKNRQHYTYMPFGEGARICIGLRFGKLQAMAGLVSILKNYTIEPTEKTRLPVKFHPKSFVTTAADGVWVKLVKRSTLM